MTPNDQYVEVVSGSTAYARFNAADTSFRVGGTLATDPNITLNVDGTGSFAGNVTVGTILTGETTTSGVRAYKDGFTFVQKPAGSTDRLW